ncbi:sulfotransferase family 2 domain-containing protein [Porticoccus sp.]
MRTIPGKPNRLDKKSMLIQLLYNRVSKIPFIPSLGQYNITVSYEKKFMWYRVAKVGTRTIFNHLKESGVNLDVEHASWLHYPVSSFEDYFKFAFVRNPWDRLASCWRNKVLESNYFQLKDSEYEKMRSFDNFVDFVSGFNVDNCDRHLRLQSALIDLNMVDYLGRMETFADDVRYVFRRLGLPDKDIVSKNVTAAKKTYQEYYNSQTVEKVAQIYRKDIQLFGYQF